MEDLGTWGVEKTAGVGIGAVPVRPSRPILDKLGGIDQGLPSAQGRNTVPYCVGTETEARASLACAVLV